MGIGIRSCHESNTSNRHLRVTNVVSAWIAVSQLIKPFGNRDVFQTSVSYFSLATIVDADISGSAYNGDAGSRDANKSYLRYAECYGSDLLPTVESALHTTRGELT